MRAVVSPQFMGWLAGFGPEAKLMGPPEVQEEYVTFCRAMLAQYDEPPREEASEEVTNEI